MKYLKLRKIKKAIVGGVVALLIAKFALDSTVAEAIGTAIGTAISVYFPRNER